MELELACFSATAWKLKEGRSGTRWKCVVCQGPPRAGSALCEKIHPPRSSKGGYLHQIGKADCSCRVTWAWTEKVNLYNGQIVISIAEKGRSIRNIVEPRVSLPDRRVSVICTGGPPLLSASFAGRFTPRKGIPVLFWWEVDLTTESVWLQCQRQAHCHCVRICRLTFICRSDDCAIFMLTWAWYRPEDAEGSKWVWLLNIVQRGWRRQQEALLAARCMPW
jgi:hypothetical protein